MRSDVMREFGGKRVSLWWIFGGRRSGEWEISSLLKEND
jgi:hypothetical protein